VSAPVALPARILLVLVSTAVYLGLAVVAFGGLRAFFSHPPLVALGIVYIALTIVAFFAGGNVSPGVREDRSNRWVLVAIVAIGLASAVIPPWSDRVGFWTIDGDAIRWLGVTLTAMGGALRLAPVFILGHRFSGLVAIQPGHALVTGGLYGVIRHPSYLGLLLGLLGWGLAFRSGLGVLLALLTVPVVVARIRSEEALLRAQFGAEYDAYRAKTSRLIPRLY
jgi:protein-S-isoprenylcysteine O-methyltransferase Ste14